MSVRWQSYLPSFKFNTELAPHRSRVRYIAARIARLALIGVVCVPRGTAEWPARVVRVRWALAVGDW